MNSDKNNVLQYGQNITFLHFHKSTLTKKCGYAMDNERK